MGDATKLLSGTTNHVELTATVKLLQRQGRLSGVANDGVKDRVGDVVVAEGAEADELPFPLLLDHDARSPIGIVTRLWASRGKLRFEAQLAKPEPDSPMAARVAEAVARLDAGVTSVSIGFRSLEHSPLADGGTMFRRVSVYELSLVSVPASPGSRVESHKAINEVPYSAGTSPVWERVKAAIGDRLEEPNLKGWAERFQKAAGAKDLRADDWVYASITANMDSTFAMLRAMATEIEGVQRRIDEQGRAYKGVWKPGTYAAGSFVTHGGSMWHADKATDFKPGEGGGWTLAVKKGSDSK